MTRMTAKSSLTRTDRHSKIYMLTLFIGLGHLVLAFCDNNSDFGYFVESTTKSNSKSENGLALEMSQAETERDTREDLQVQAKSTDMEAEISATPLSNQKTHPQADQTEYMLGRQVILKKRREALVTYVEQTPNFGNVSIKSKDNDTKHINGTIDLDANDTIDINVNGTESMEVNETATNGTQRKRWECTPTPFQQNPDETTKVRIVNDSELSAALTKSNETEECFLLYFFLRWCHFCAEMSVEMNTVGRLYPMLPVLAVDAINSSSVAAKFGVAGVPTLLLFYSGRPVVKFNRSRSLDDLQLFIKETTDFDPEGKLEINDADFDGPLPTKIEERKDMYLTFSLTFLALLSLVTTVRTKTCKDILQSLKERLLRLWHKEEHDKQE